MNSLRALLWVVCVVAGCAANVTAPVPASVAAVDRERSSPAFPTSATSTSSDVFYADPDSPAALWLRGHPDDPLAAEIQSAIAAQPAARWFGEWSGDVGPAVTRYVEAASAAQRIPVLVAYNVPLRDCRQHSKGGAATADAYRQWIAAFVAGIGTHTAVVILEPDGLALIDCLQAQAQLDRLELLRYAVAQFKGRAVNARVYLDIGHSGWLPAGVAAQRLVSAGIQHVQGFSLNVSNFRTTSDNASYGRTVAALLAERGLVKTFVVDTSRNGNGPLGTQWCDPPGRRLGELSGMQVNDPMELHLWIKNPGSADGCAAAAGTFVPALAMRLIRGT